MGQQQSGNENMLKNTRQKMYTYAATVDASSKRAQCYHIACISVPDTIAQALINDHCDADSHLRAAMLMVHAGAAKYTPNKKSGLYGSFLFEDGSTLN